MHRPAHVHLRVHLGEPEQPPPSRTRPVHEVEFAPPVDARDAVTIEARPAARELPDRPLLPRSELIGWSASASAHAPTREY